MPCLNYTTAFNRYKAKLDNPNWAVSAISADGALVISCWEQYFERPADGVLRYVDSLSRWNGSNRAGWNLLRRHLEMTLAGKLEVRLVLAKTDNPTAVAKGGDASKLNNTFSRLNELLRQSRFKPIEAEVLIAQPGISAANRSEDQDMVIATAMVYLKETIGCDLQILCNV